MIDKRIKTANLELRELIAATGSDLMELAGVGPSGAARLLGDVGDISRFADKGRFASWNGTAPLDASSGDQNRHRLSRAGNRRINRTLHIMALTALRHGGEARAYYDRKTAAGKTKMEAMRCLKRRLSDIVYARMKADAQRLADAAADTGRHRWGGPGRTTGGDTSIQRGRLTPRHRHFGSVSSRTRRPATLEPLSPPRLDTEGSHERAAVRLPWSEVAVYFLGLAVAGLLSSPGPAWLRAVTRRW